MNHHPALLDHLVIVAPTLDAGVSWCEATLGITPGPGGEHPLMGTHNRLFRIATVDFPRAYCEIIAINSVAPVPIPARLGRWFDMDSPALQQRVAATGPQLVHFVVNVPDLAHALAALRAQGLERGPALQASRMTPRGLLHWQISVRDDGQRLMNGTLPTLIEWGDTHPAGGMADSGVTLQRLSVTHPQAATLRAAYEAIGLQRITVHEGPAKVAATLTTPRGTITLQSHGI